MLSLLPHTLDLHCPRAARLYSIHAGCKWHIQAIYFQVADLYVEQHHWAYLIGPLSGEATAVLSGFMRYPQKSHAVTVSRAIRHDSWTCNPIARVALGSKMGGYMYSSTLRSMTRLCSNQAPCASGICMIKSAHFGQTFFRSHWAPEYIRIMQDAIGIFRPSISGG